MSCRAVGLLAEVAGTVVGVVGSAGGRTDGASSEDVEDGLLFWCESVAPLGPSWMGLSLDVDLQVPFLVVAVLPYLGQKLCARSYTKCVLSSFGCCAEVVWWQVVELVLGAGALDCAGDVRLGAVWVRKG